jgi:hypothetical protein
MQFWNQRLAISNSNIVNQHYSYCSIYNYLSVANELQEDSVCANFAHTAEDGKEYQTKFYSLEAIIAVGYRVI